MPLSDRNRPKVKAWYTIRELSELGGLDRRELARELRALGVSIRHRRGQSAKVLITELRDAAPEVWRALLAVGAVSEPPQTPAA